MRTPSTIAAELEAAFTGGKTERELLVLIRELRAAIDYPALYWTDDIVPDKPGLWAFMSPQNDTVYYQPVSQEGAEYPERWECGRWCRVGSVPEIKYYAKNLRQ